MPRTTLTVTTLTGPFPSAGAAVTINNADASNKNQFFATGRDLLLIRNAHASTAKTYQVDGAVNLYNRTANYTGSLAAGVMVGMFMKQVENFRQPDGMIYCEGEDNNIKFIVLRGGGLV